VRYSTPFSSPLSVSPPQRFVLDPCSYRSPPYKPLIRLRWSTFVLPLLVFFLYDPPSFVVVFQLCARTACYGSPCPAVYCDRFEKPASPNLMAPEEEGRTSAGPGQSEDIREASEPSSFSPPPLPSLILSRLPGTPPSHPSLPPPTPFVIYEHAPLSLDSFSDKWFFRSSIRP